MCRGRHVVVTSAARGIGAAIAERLAQQGARLTMIGRDAKTLRRVAARLPGAADVCIASADVTQPASVTAAFEAARVALGPVDMLVNNAGQAFSAPFSKISLAHWQQMLSVNLTGSFLCCQAALPDMLAGRRGRIVNIASTAGLRGYAYVAAYSAAKHGVIGMTRSLALELAPRGITANAVCPGYTDTDIVRDSVARLVAQTGRSTNAARAELVKGNPQGRLVTPAEVADTVAWLCSDGAGAITGQAISVSGGEVAG